jgi:hypothetical protein
MLGQNQGIDSRNKKNLNYNDAFSSLVGKNGFGVSATSFVGSCAWSVILSVSTASFKVVLISLIFSAASSILPTSIMC